MFPSKLKNENSKYIGFILQFPLLAASVTLDSKSQIQKSNKHE